MVAACPFPSPRGTPIRIEQLATALAARNHDVHLVTYHLGETLIDPPFRLHRTVSVPTYRKQSPGPSYQKLFVLDPLLARTLGKVLERYRVDIVHAHHFEGLIAAMAGRRHRAVPVVFDAHTLLESELPFYRLGMPNEVKRRLGRWLDRLLPPRADHVIAVADRIRERLVDDHGLPSDDVSVVPNGVERELFAAPDGRSARPGKSWTLVFTGNPASYQGIDHMLAALVRLLEMQIDVRLRVVSESPLDQVDARARSSGVRHAVDLVRCDFSRVPDHLAAADVALNPRTECDGVPQKLVNYMAAGRPIVSFAGSATHLARGDMGLIVPDGDIKAFARAVRRLLEDRDLAKRLGDNARRFARTYLSWEGAARGCEEVYDRLLAPDESIPADERAR